MLDVRMALLFSYPLLLFVVDLRYYF